jgi:hypothetical protein
MEPDKVIEKLVAYLLDHKPEDPVSEMRTLSVIDPLHDSIP